jgi:two-component system, sensor histidine kinase YesM
MKCGGIMLWKPSMKIRTRLILYFLILAILPLTVVNVLSFYKYKEQIELQAIGVAQTSVRQISSNVDTYMLDLLSIAKVIVLDRSIIRWISLDSAAKRLQDAESLRKSIKEELEIRYFMNAQKGSRPYIQGIYLISIRSPSDMQIKFGTDNDLSPKLLMQQDWWSEAVSRQEIVFIPPHSPDYFLTPVGSDPCINLLYPIPQQQGNTKSWIMFQMTTRVLVEEFETGIGYAGDKVGLVDNQGRILIGKQEMSEQQHKELSIRYESPITGWITVGQIPKAQLFRSSIEVGRIITIITVAASVLGLVLAFALANHVLKPLRLLWDAIRITKTGSFRKKVAILANDEIGELSGSYNEMLDTINRLLKRVAEEESAKKDAELKALQYQINPHFLYNTLNSVQWLAVMHGVPQIKELIAALIKLLQSSLGKQGAFLTLSEELEDLKNYVLIQQFRFGEELNVEYDVDPGTLNCTVPRLILQPLVENSIFHGLEDGKGHIWIKAKREEQTLVLSIADNGIGMTDEQMQKLLGEESEFKGKYSGIGFHNVSEKIKRLYGSPYGIQIRSEFGQGTMVIIKMPIQEV